MRINKTVWRKVTLLSVSTATLASLASGASAAPVDRTDQGRDAHVTTIAAEADPNSVAEYWTDDKMDQTKGDEIDPESEGVPSAYGPIQTPDGDRLGYGRPAQPYAKYSGTRPMGKLVFAMKGQAGKGDDIDNNCSATAIGGNLILTAAHCVMDNESSSNLATKLAFIPNYHHGNASHPFGLWPVEKSYIPTVYKDEVDKGKDGSIDPYDVAVMKVATNDQGATLETILGAKSKTITRDIGAPRQGYTYGYPAMGGKKYTGAEMFRCLSTLQDTRPKDDEITQIKAGSCAVQGGNSGGPVVDGQGTVIAVTQSREPVSGTKGAKATSNYTRLHPETFGRIKTEATSDN